MYSCSLGLLTCLSVPSTFPSVVAGFLFRPVVYAVAIVLLGSQVGVIVAFNLARTALKPWVHAKFSHDVRFRAIDAAISKQGWRVVLLLRLSPMFPFGLCNYFLSLTSMSILEVMAATLAGNLPGAIMHTFVGSLIANIAGIDNYQVPFKTKMMTILLSISFSILSVVFISVISKRALREALEQSDDECDDEDRESQHSLDSQGVSSDGRVRARTTRHSEGQSSEDVSPTQLDPLIEQMDPLTELVEPGGRVSEFTLSEKRLLYGTSVVTFLMLVSGIPMILWLPED